MSNSLCAFHKIKSFLHDVNHLPSTEWEILNVGNNNEETKYGISNEHINKCGGCK
jgi:hypothetical protein